MISATSSGVAFSCSEWRVRFAPAHVAVAWSPAAASDALRHQFAARAASSSPGLRRAAAWVSSTAAKLRDLFASSLQGRCRNSCASSSCRSAKRAASMPQGQAQVARGLFERRAQLGRSRQSRALVRPSARASRARSRICAVDTLSPKNSAGDFRQLVRLVEDHRVAGRQQFGHALVAQHDVGEEQVVIDHHQVGRHRLAPRLHARSSPCVAGIPGRGSSRASRSPWLQTGEFSGHVQAFGLVAGLACAWRSARCARSAPASSRVDEAARRPARAPDGSGRRSWRGP